MAFQFHCPQGHLLSAHEYQAGQQTQCPMCGLAFIVPYPAAMAPPVPSPMVHYPHVPAPPPPPPPAAGPLPAAAPETPIADRFAALAAAAEAAEADSQDAAPPVEATSEVPSEPMLLHIPCPKGHVLETPEEMLDQEVLCPHCQAQFVLRRKNSVEYQRKKEEEERIREIKTGNFWLNLAIVVVVLVVLGLVALIVVRSLMQTPVSTSRSNHDLANSVSIT